MNYLKFFALLLLIVTLSSTIECRKKNVYNYGKTKMEYGNRRMTEMSVHVSGNCQTNGECPFGYTCTNQMCVKPIVNGNQRTRNFVQCNDLEKDCYKFQSYCRDSAYNDVLRERCKRTCGFCSPS
ncbi:ShKT domain-containing protein [Strongyloides ratti]|uniref:ShKT domain-containing protein n=1 Tax=Strongyloides ratti TaxID=34506 RepID=A0A090L087_STRRB|nr:ShKT domain-containing protein [Strongyloides ratti]CEF60904.1 ShKT domain-containing protein [Strongyloides ratti]